MGFARRRRAIGGASGRRRRYTLHGHSTIGEDDDKHLPYLVHHLDSDMNQENATMARTRVLRRLHDTMVLAQRLCSGPVMTMMDEFHKGAYATLE